MNNDTFPQKISLDGNWEFTYTREIEKENPRIPERNRFTVQMPVPGYWDDNVERMQSSGFWSTARFNPDFRPIDFPMGDNMPPDASLPYLLGVGWYRKSFHAAPGWQGGEITLAIGGVVLEAWVWINGELLKYHLGHSTPFEIPIGKKLKYGEENEIVMSVANTRTDRLGCVIRGFKGSSAGIYRPVYLSIAGDVHIEDCYIYPSKGLTNLHWLVKLSGGAAGNKPLQISWRIRDPDTKKLMAEGLQAAPGTGPKWSTGSFNLQPWSEHTPKLYEIDISLIQEGKVLDRKTQSFGLRLLERQDTSLLLNGRPVFLRGTTEHAYFPLTCTPPRDIETYRNNISKLKALGFNWLRFHTWVPSEEYMQAADQLGIMIQVEAPLGFGRQEWIDILNTCRKHPSVVIYCCGNEEQIDEKKLGQLSEMAVLCHTLVPDALFNPQEAMRGIEYHLDESGNVDEPFPHNPERLEKIREFSDVFGQYPLGLLSYTSVNGDWRVLDHRLAIYQRPCLSHENGIHGNYLNLDLEHRYEGTRIGTDMFASVRRNLKKEGLLHRASLYYRNSCAWMRILRKHNLEMSRKCRFNAGYDLLGAIDYHWHRCGYPCGIMNEFYELKPGESTADVLEYNGESLLLLDHTNNRNLYSGDVLALDLFSSLYGSGPLEKGSLSWYLADDRHFIYERGECELQEISNGKIEKLATLSINAPSLEKPSKITLYVRLSGGEYEITNHWDFWVFPKPLLTQVKIALSPEIKAKYKNLFPGTPDKDCMDGDTSSIRITTSLDKAMVNFLLQGGRGILLGSRPFPALPTSFQLSVTGRVQGNLSTVIEDHPLMKTFPHEGFCDWQFYNMLEGGEAVVFNGLDLPFKPILEMVSSFKLLRKQACIFEICVGKGRLLVSSLNLEETDPAAMFLLNQMLDYAGSDQFRPENAVPLEEIFRILGTALHLGYDFTTDEALDPNVSRK